MLFCGGGVNGATFKKLGNGSTSEPKLQGVLWFLLVALGESHSWGADHRVRYFIELSTIERFADLDRIRSLATRIKRNRLPRKEQIALRELDKAFVRRTQGKSDKAWQNDFHGGDDEIVDA